MPCFNALNFYLILIFHGFHEGQINHLLMEFWFEL